MFVMKRGEVAVEVVELEQSEGNVYVRIDGLVGLSCLEDGRVIQLNQKWLLEKGYRVEIVN